jgi:N6-L-threonylcarbamoyladenine synthase
MINILGIESSCDDTSVAIINSDKRILSNIVISQNDEHRLYQGVVPEIASRAHLNNIENAMNMALITANIKLSDINVIAATSGPGLIGGVIVGSMFARSLCSVLKLPFIAINHLEGHALTARLTHNISYPYLLLLVSGGHCQFISVEDLGKYKILGRTIDDALGEAFDKVAKMLKLGFPGGPIVEERAKFGDEHKYKLPRPIIFEQDCNMSFSGLKTAISLLISKIDIITDEVINDICASFQHVIYEILSVKILKAINKYELLTENYSKKIILSGGVAANQYLKNKLQQVAEKQNYELITPPIKLCTDNAAMIAYAGLERFNKGQTNSFNFCPKARWSLEEL